VAIASANVLNHFVPLLFYEWPRAPDGVHPRSAASAYGDVHQAAHHRLRRALVFFGFHCVIVGYLFFRSTFFPRILGALLAVAGLCYLTNSFASFLSSAFAAHLFPYTLALGNTVASLAPGDRRERSTLEGAGQHGGNAHMKAAVYSSRIGSTPA